MRTRTETVVSIDRAWAATDDDLRMFDVILSEGTTDWFVTQYDGLESLWYVKGGKIYDGDGNHAGEMSKGKNE